MEKYSGFSILKLADPSNTHSEPGPSHEGFDFVSKEKAPNANNARRILTGFNPTFKDNVATFDSRQERDEAYLHLSRSNMIGSYKKDGNFNIIIEERETPKGWEGAEIGNEESPDGHRNPPSNVSWGDEEGVRDNLEGKIAAVADFPQQFNESLSAGGTTFACTLIRATTVPNWKDVSRQSFDAGNVIPYDLKVKVAREKVKVIGELWKLSKGQVIVTKNAEGGYNFRENIDDPTSANLDQKPASSAKAIIMKILQKHDPQKGKAILERVRF